MNTSEVAKLLGVSASTIQRWIKQLELPMERNERGHFHFNQDDIELLKKIQEQVQNGMLLQDLLSVKETKKRKGAMKATENHAQVERLFSIVNELENKINRKADSVASYQLLQHRQEIEELKSKVNELSLQLELLQSELNKHELPPLLDEPFVLEQGKVKRRKKNIVSSLFGF